MRQYLCGKIGFFDAGTSDSESASLWFPANVPDTPIWHKSPQWEQAAQTTSQKDYTPPTALLPKHRTWSGGLLFTLPNAGLSDADRNWSQPFPSEGPGNDSSSCVEAKATTNCRNAAQAPLDNRPPNIPDR